MAGLNGKIPNFLLKEFTIVAGFTLSNQAVLKTCTKELVRGTAGYLQTCNFECLTSGSFECTKELSPGQQSFQMPSLQ